MKFFDYYRTRQGSAQTAKERLQHIVVYERIQNSGLEFLPVLEKDLLEVIQRFVNVDKESVSIALDNEDDHQVLQIRIGLPQNKSGSRKSRARQNLLPGLAPS